MDYTAISQKIVLDFIKNKNLEFKSYIYPGADEVGSSLLARCLNDFLGRTVKIMHFILLTFGPNINSFI
jgi:hypothetical protein